MIGRITSYAHARLITPASQRLAGVPSPKEKARTVIEYGRRYGRATLIETGTFHGGTVAAALPHFEQIYTVELDQALYEAARDRFAGEPKVTVIHGDSHTELSRLAAEIDAPALFWLDAHYSAGETAKGTHDPPLPWELGAIIGRREPDVILIDDARLMGATSGYPSLEAIRDLVGDRAVTFEVRRDIIRIALAP
jgi:hypothetical protein